MNDPSQPPRFPSWLAPAVVVMMAMQLGLSWLQGSLIHRQHQDLVALREDVQSLADYLDQGTAEGDYEEQGLAPAHRRSHKAPRYVRVRMLQVEEDQAQDLQEAKVSAQKAVSEAREVQAKLSIEENIRKAEAKAKVEETERTWLKWVWVALGTGLVAVGIRSWLRRRG